VVLAKACVLLLQQPAVPLVLTLMTVQIAKHLLLTWKI
jgi:hypothetical protein